MIEEYIKICKHILKWERKFDLNPKATVTNARIMKKIKSLVAKALRLEEIMKVPEGKRFTDAYR